VKKSNLSINRTNIAVTALFVSEECQLDLQE
jgi:hypothetical protein